MEIISKKLIKVGNYNVNDYFIGFKDGHYSNAFLTTKAGEIVDFDIVSTNKVLKKKDVKFIYKLISDNHTKDCRPL